MAAGSDPAIDLRYPIGPDPRVMALDPAARTRAIADIAELPGRLRDAVKGLGDAQLDTRYRPGGWTVRQVVHHVADSHLNAYLRLKLALTEPGPTIRPYREELWAELPEARSAPVELSLVLLDALHARWTIALRALSPADCARPYTHPSSGAWTIDGLIASYAWHGKHHLAHVTSLAEREGWARIADPR